MSLSTLYPEQQNVFDFIIRLDRRRTPDEQYVFRLDAPGGHGKTHLLKLIVHLFHVQVVTPTHKATSLYADCFDDERNWRVVELYLLDSSVGFPSGG